MTTPPAPAASTGPGPSKPGPLRATARGTVTRRTATSETTETKETTDG